MINSAMLLGLKVVESNIVPRNSNVIVMDTIYVRSMWVFRQEVHRANGERLPRRTKKRLKKEFWG